MEKQSVVILLGFLILMTFCVFFIIFVIQFTRRKYRHKKEQLKNSVSVMEAERSRIGRDIHDDIAPLLTTLQLSNQGIALKHKLPEEDLRSQSEILQTIYSSIRILSRSLYPLALERFGISKAVEDLAHLIRQSSDIKVILDFSSFSQSLEFERELALYRIIQEFCNNSMKHSSCSMIEISASESDSFKIISISDDGVGFDMQMTQKGLGLKNMEMRAELAGFKYELTSIKGQGTLITLTNKTAL